MAGATSISAMAALTSDAKTTPKVILIKPKQMKLNRFADEVGNKGSFVIAAGRKK